MSVTRVLCVLALIVCYHSVSAQDLKYNDDCEDSLQCSNSNEMECRDNKCQCKTNFMYDGAECLGSLGLGQECERDLECLDPSDVKQKTVWCYNRQCACRSGFKRDGTRCVIGGDCTQDSDCHQLDNSFCNKLMRDRYQCTCHDNFVPAANNTKCLSIARHLEICEESHQCTYSIETECQDSICQCSTSTEYKEGQCLLRKLAIGGSCTTSAECISNAECVNQVCTCTNNLVPDSSNNQCLPRVGHGQSCSESIQCQALGGAECISNTCQCTSGFNFTGNRCTGNIGLGLSCPGDVHCFVRNDLGQVTVWCHNGQCACRQGFRREDERCVIGGDCTDNNGCSGLPNSHCDTRARDRPRCVCTENHISVANNTRCLPIATSVGSGCEFNEQCSHRLGRAVCSGNQCRCAEGASLQNNTCTVQGSCSTDDDCNQLGNSYCNKQVQDKYQCACKEGFNLVQNNTKCLPSTPGQPGAAVRIVLSFSCFVLVWMVKLL